MAQAVVQSSYEDEPNIPVNLVGVGIISELEITPDPLNFGATYVGCEKGNTITLTNVGSESLDVTNIEYVDAGFSVLLSQLQTCGLFRSHWRVRNSRGRIYACSRRRGWRLFSVTSTEPMGVRTVGAYWNRYLQLRYEQIWENPVDPPSDIVFQLIWLLDGR